MFTAFSGELRRENIDTQYSYPGCPDLRCNFLFTNWIVLKKWTFNVRNAIKKLDRTFWIARYISEKK